MSAFLKKKNTNQPARRRVASGETDRSGAGRESQNHFKRGRTIAAGSYARQKSTNDKIHGDLSPRETDAVMSAYTPARDAMMAQQASDDKLNLMRQWKGQDLTNAPQEVRDLFGKAPDTDTLVNRYLAQTLSPEGQQQRRQHETGLAMLKAAGRQRETDPAQQQKQWLDTYFPTPGGETPDATKQRAWAAQMHNYLAPITRKSPQELYPYLAQAALLQKGTDESDDAFGLRQEAYLSKLLGLGLRQAMGR